MILDGFGTTNYLGEDMALFFTCVLRPYQNWQTTSSPTAKLIMKFLKRNYNIEPISLAAAAAQATPQPILQPPTDKIIAESSALSWYYTILLFVKHLCRLNPDFMDNFDTTLKSYIDGTIDLNAMVDINTDPAAGSRINYDQLRQWIQNNSAKRYPRFMTKVASLTNSFKIKFLNGDFDTDFCDCLGFSLFSNNPTIQQLFPDVAAAVGTKLNAATNFCTTSCGN